MSTDPAQPPVDLQRLSDAWQRFGCAVCAHVPSRWAQEGARIELDHILSRAQGGPTTEENLMGLCGALCDHKCHWRKHQGLLKIRWAENVSSWVWSDEQGVTGICRPLDTAMVEEAGQDASLILSTRTLERRNVSVIPDEYVPGDFPTGYGARQAEQRFLKIREAYQDLEQGWLTLALVVQYSVAQSDHAQLGYATKSQWADAIGIGKSQLSKLMLVGRIFQGDWTKLPEQDRRQLSQEGMYIAAKMVETGRWDHQQALHEAVANPVSYLYAIYREANMKDLCECSTCGQKHTPGAAFIKAGGPPKTMS